MAQKLDVFWVMLFALKNRKGADFWARFVFPNYVKMDSNPKPSTVGVAYSRGSDTGAPAEMLGISVIYFSEHGA